MRIVLLERDGDLITFICTDADRTAPHVISPMDLEPPKGAA
jgi:hypothetical protein